MIRCVLYLACIGILSFVVGRLLPKRWFDPQAFPWRSFPFERDGALYRRLAIHKWQSRIPDMSRLFPGLMPRKALLEKPTASRLELMVQETCVAECIHGVLCLCGLPCLWLWPGAGGITVTVLYVLGNLPFILVQRYNRPRLQRLQQRLKEREASV